jgi:type II restriction/modification system DNA methylase subunit YeeA
VLDPACGSGNFLYVALKALKDIEHRANLDAEALGLPRGFPRVGPESVLGIELSPYAAELARVSVWIGEIQWMRRNGFDAAKNPILRPLETIECRDAVLNDDGTRAEWPEADAIIGNPPFLGNKKMIAELGEDYTRALRKAWPEVPGGVDLVCYWFAKAWSMIVAGSFRRAGLVSTNSIRGGANREVLKPIL